MARKPKRKHHNPKRDYLFLPEKFHKSHDVCMALLGQLEEMVMHEDYRPLRYKTIPLTDAELPKDVHILDYLLQSGRKKEHDDIVRNNIIIGLITDVCYFTQEAMTCSLKMRLSVCFALLRKPFVYTLIVILRLIFEERFIDKFNNDEGFDPAKIDAADRMELLSVVISVLPHNQATANDINEWIFDKKNPSSIINFSDSALHLTTTRNKHNATEKQNFNFIFSDAEAIDSQWEFLYLKMPALLLFMVQVCDILIVSEPDIKDDVYAKRLIKRVEILKGV